MTELRPVPWVPVARWHRLVQAARHEDAKANASASDRPASLLLASVIRSSDGEKAGAYPQAEAVCHPSPTAETVGATTEGREVAD